MKTKIVINKPNICCGNFELSYLATSIINKLLKTPDDNKMNINGHFEKPFNFIEDNIISKDIPRHNKHLVNTVKKLGIRANGKCCRLFIEEIDNNEYLIMMGENRNEYIVTPDNIKWNIIK